MGMDSKRSIVIIDLASIGGRDSCRITREGDDLDLGLGSLAQQVHSASGAGENRPTEKSWC